MEQWYRDPIQDIKNRGHICIAPEDVEGWEDVSCGARGVFKKLVNEGHGDRHPTEGDVCSCHLVGYYDDAEFENTRIGEGHPWEFHCGGGQVISGLEYAVASMKEGEIAKFIIDPIFAYRDRGYEKSVPPNAVIEYEVELLSVNREPTEAEKLKQALALKEKGNALFKDGLYDEAREQYKEAKQLLGIFPWRIKDKELLKQQSELRVVVLANQVHCVAKQENWKEVVKLSSEVFRFDKNNIKTLYRRAQAYYNLQDFELSHTDLDHILTLDPDNCDVKLLRRLLKKSEDEVAQRQRQMYANIWRDDRPPTTTAPHVEGENPGGLLDATAGPPSKS
eukprot:GGOE01000846.1.p1 GENE.GGOE01000846.1~~GGOE01000846.1.p1  ORF type:complete len:343 (+),score=71.51 GGOE01000846.1:25-1029(+)